MSGEGNFPSTQKQVSVFQRLHTICFHFVPSSSFSVWLAFHFSLSCSASPSFSPACCLWGNPWQIKLRRTYQRQITSGALRKALLHQSARVLRRVSSSQCLTCELDMHPTEEEVEKWYPHYSKWIKIYPSQTHNIARHTCFVFHGNHIYNYIYNSTWKYTKIRFFFVFSQDDLIYLTSLWHFMINNVID